MNNSPETKASDIVSFKTGKLNSNAAKAFGKYPFFTCAQQTYHIDKYSYDTECVLLAGNNAAGIFSLKYYKGKFDAYQRTYIIESLDRKKLRIKYFFYALQPFLSHFEQSSTGVTTKFLTVGILNNLKIPIPSPALQKKVAAILSAYDDLIENNNRRIAILEKMAGEIYKEWFVRMRFPGGWARKKLGKVTVIIQRGISPKYDENSNQLVINQKCIRNGNIDLSLSRKHSTIVAKNKFIKFGDTLINSTGVGTLGRVSIVSFPESDRTVDSHITICRANKNEVQPLYLGYTVKFFQPYFEYMATGATGQVELNKGLIETIEIVLPSTELQTNFQDRIEKILEQKNYFIKKNSNLKQTRDRLLTRLISGKLSVADLDIRFPRSMREESDAELHP